MFRKQPTLGNSSPIKSSARRALAQEISSLYAVPPEDVKALLPDPIQQCKGQTSGGEHFTLYAGADGGPVLFRLGKGEQGRLMPSLYTIWSSPDNIGLPMLVTNDMVLEKLLGGADLMLPGVASRSLQDLPDGLHAGATVGIGTLSVPGAVRAIGVLSASSAALKREGKGKACECIHVEGDMLWALGSKRQAEPRARAKTDDTRTSETSVDATAEAVDALTVTEDKQDGQDRPPSTLQPSDVDAILQEALLYCISQKLAKDHSVFPLSSSKIMDTYILPSRRATYGEQEVSIRKSSFKNASAFLKQAKKTGLITTKEAKGGEVSVVAVNAGHAELKGFKPYKTVGDLQRQEKKKEDRSEKQQLDASKRSIEVSQLYKPHGQSAPMCADLGFSRDAMLLPTEIRAAVNEYIIKHSLINPHDQSYLTFNEMLSQALLKKGEQLDFIPRSQALERLLDSMQAWCRVVLKEGGQTQEILTKGLGQKISISVKKRQGKKLVTIIEGIETFLIPPSKLSEDLQIKCASSSTYSELPQSSPKKPLFEVVVQGSQTAIVTKELSDTWGVPKQWISVAK